jgi:fatty-acyl-CoA synthase
VDASLVSKFAEILPHAPAVKHLIVSGAPLSQTPGADELTGVAVHEYEELLAAEPDSFDWPELDEFSAAAMCYTSGTTGHPKGIVYSHRSSYLHSMGACLGNAFGLSERDRVLPVVPMFHANAWAWPTPACCPARP